MTSPATDRVIYEVEGLVDPSVAGDFDRWLPGHIREVLACPGFTGAEIQSPAGAGGRALRRCQYRLQDAAALADAAPRRADPRVHRRPAPALPAAVQAVSRTERGLLRTVGRAAAGGHHPRRGPGSGGADPHRAIRGPGRHAHDGDSGIDDGELLGLASLLLALYVPWYVFRAMCVVYGQGRALTLAKFLVISARYFILLGIAMAAGFLYSMLSL